MSIKAKRPYKALHPSELLEDLLEELEITQYRLSKETGIPHATITRIMKNEARITAEIALRLGLFFGNTPQFWINCQSYYDLYEVEKSKGKIIEKSITPYSSHLVTA